MSEWFDAEARVERAHELYEAGRWDEAEALLREAIALHPFRAEWYFNLGLTLEAAGRFDDAVQAYRDASHNDPEDPQAALALGANLLRSDDPASLREAIICFEAAERLDPDQAGPFVHRIEAYARLGDHEQAEVMFYMAQQLDPKDANAYVALADSLLDRKLYDKAVWCLREAAQIDSQLPRVHARLGEAYAATGRLERARQLYLRELRQDPGDIDTLLDLGELLVEMNRYSEAGEKFRRVLELEPDNTDAHYALGDLYELQGSPKEALAQFDVVLRLEPEYAGAGRRLARLLLNRGVEGDGDRCVNLLATDLAKFDAEPDAFNADELDDLGRLLIDAGRPQEARRVLRRLCEMRPASAEAMHQFSIACYQSGDRAAGIEASRAVFRLDPGFVPAMYNLAVAHLFERKWRRARYWARRARLADPDDASVRRLRWQLRLHAFGQAMSWVSRKTAKAIRPLRRRRRVVDNGR